MQPTLQQIPGGNPLAGMMMNPLISKLSAIREASQDHATYGGISAKCYGFMASILVGAALVLLVQLLDPMVMDANEEITYMSPALVVLGALSLVSFLVTPFVAFLIKAAIPVAGTMYCASTGFLFAFFALVAPELRGAILLAVILTVTIVAVMALIYAKGWVKVDQKFRTVLSALFWSTVGTSLLVGVCYFIPALQSVPAVFQENPLAGLLGSVLYVVIATLFLLVDFDTIQQAVEHKLPRKYEWYAAFGLAFSVIWLFLKVFSLISRARSSNK